MAVFCKPFTTARVRYFDGARPTRPPCGFTRGLHNRVRPHDFSYALNNEIGLKVSMLI